MGVKVTLPAFAVAAGLAFQAAFLADHGFLLAHRAPLARHAVHADATGRGAGGDGLGGVGAASGEGGEFGGVEVFLEGFQGDGDQVGFTADEAAVVAAVQAAVDAAEGFDDGLGGDAVLEGDADDAAEGFAVGVRFVSGAA